MATKIVYQINASGHFVSQVEADESPLEPGVFLIPAGCVEAAPPTPGAHQWPAWIAGAWGFVPDFRGTVGYKPTGEAITITDLGDTLESLGLSATPPPDYSAALLAGAVRISRKDARKQQQAQRLAARGDTLGALKLLNDL